MASTYATSFSNGPAITYNYVPSNWTITSNSWSTTTDLDASVYKRASAKINKNASDRLYSWINLDDEISQLFSPSRPKLEKGETYTLPDGSELIIDENGNYVINDQNARISYKANNNRNFSPHINASDMLADFLRDAIKSTGIGKEEAMQLPVRLFISWLIIEAANRDGDDVPDDIKPLAADPDIIKIKRPRCLKCNRYIPRLHANNGFMFCSPEHAIKAIEHKRTA